MLPLKPQLTVSCFSAYSTAGLIVLTKVNCTSSVTKDYRKNKIKFVHAISCLINMLTWDFFVVNLFCAHYQFFTNACWTWQVWKHVAVFLNDGERLQHGEEYGKPFNWSSPRQNLLKSQLTLSNVCYKYSSEAICSCSNERRISFCVVRVSKIP